MPGHIFLSYSRQDRAYVDKLAAEMAGAGLSVWFDHGLAAGEQWADVLEQQIEDCAVFVVVMSTASAASDWVKREVGFAQDLGKPTVPLLFSGRLWFRLHNLHYVDVTDGRLPDASFVPRLMALGAVAAPEAAGPQPAEFEPVAVLRPAPMAAAPGRDTATRRMRSAVEQASRMTTSRVGKSKAHVGAVSSVAWAPESPRFVTTGVDGTCQVWDAESGRVSQVIDLPQSKPSLLAVWRNENFVITGEHDGLRWWDSRTGREVLTSLGHGRITALGAMAGSQADNELVVAGTARGRVLLVRMGAVEDLRAGRKSKHAVLPPESRVVAVAVGRNHGLTGDRTPVLAAVDLNREGASRLSMWPVLFSGPGRRSRVPLAARATLSAEQIAWSRDGDLAVANPVLEPGRRGPAIEVWPGGVVLDKVAISLGRADDSASASVTSVSWAPGRRRLAVGMSDGTVNVCDVERGVVVRRLLTGSTGKVSIGWSASGTLLAAGVAEGRQPTRIWHAEDGAPVFSIEMPVSAVAWAPRGDALVVGASSGDVWVHRFAG